MAYSYLGNIPKDYRANDWKLSSHWVVDNRDNKFFALDGSYRRISLSYGEFNNYFDTKQSGNYLESELVLAQYKRISPKWFFSGAFDLRHRSLRNAPYYLTQALGYSQYVRGYETNVIDGNDFFLLKLGLRYALFQGKLRMKWLPLKAYQLAPVGIFLSAFKTLSYVFIFLRVFYES